MEKNEKTHLEVEQTLGLEGSGGTPKRLFKALIALVILALGGFLIWKWSAGGKGITTYYKTQEAVRGDLTVIVTATGTLQPTNQVEVSSELSGIVKSVEVDYNSRVKAGQVLAVLDPSKLEAQVLQSRAALEAAEGKLLQVQATLQEARDKLERFKTVRALSQHKVPSPAEFQAAEAALERAKADEVSARAAVSQARATLKAQETDLSKTVIRSPIKGIVLNRNVEPGQTVAAALQAPVLFTLAEDLAQMELIVDVDEADIGKVQEGQKAVFRVDAYPQRIFEARIKQTRYGSKTVSGVVTYETVLTVDNRELLLRPGMTATAEITVQKVQNAVLIPQAALRFIPAVEEKKEQPSKGLVSSLLPRPPRPSERPPQEINLYKKEQTVWVLKEGKPQAVSILIGASDGNMTEVVAGEIKPGMPLIIDQLKGVR